MFAQLKMDILKHIRSTVSGDKHRFTFGDINIDFTYITDRIIAMSFPAEGVERTYRNDINDVSLVLSSRHPRKFRVYNLTERKYDYSKFENNVVTCGWPDHYSPPLLVLCQLMKDIHNYLLEDEEHVVALHCLAGKGRTGTVIACYLLYSGLFREPASARSYFAYKRSSTNWGVVGPAQIRYVNYFGEILNHALPKLEPLRLSKIVFHRTPKLFIGSSKVNGWTPIIQIKEYNNVRFPEQPLLWQNEEMTYTEKTVSVTLELDLVLIGDILVDIFHHNWGQAMLYACFNFGSRNDLVAMISFNTGMLDKKPKEKTLRVRFTKSEIDKVNNDKRFPSDFWVEFHFVHLHFDIPPTRIYSEIVWEEILNEKRGRNGETCFFPKDPQLQEKLQEIANFQLDNPLESDHTNVAFLNKGGWLTKQANNQFKNWNRRWFVLTPNYLEYFQKPNSIPPLGRIKISDIQAVFRIPYKTKYLPRHRDSHGSDNDSKERDKEVKEREIKDADEEGDIYKDKDDNTGQYSEDDRGYFSNNNDAHAHIHTNANTSAEHDLIDCQQDENEYDEMHFEMPDKINDVSLDGERVYPNSFMMKTSMSNVICYADNQAEMEEWINAIETCVQVHVKEEQRKIQNCYGLCTVSVDEANGLIRQALTKASVDAYAVILYDKQRWRTTTCPSSLDPVWKHDFKFHLFREVPAMLTIQIYDEHFLGDTLLGSCTLDLTPFLPEEEPICQKRQYHLMKSGRKLNETFWITLTYIPKNSTKKTIPSPTIFPSLTVPSPNSIPVVLDSIPRHPQLAKRAAIHDSPQIQELISHSKQKFPSAVPLHSEAIPLKEVPDATKDVVSETPPTTGVSITTSMTNIPLQTSSTTPQKPKSAPSTPTVTRSPMLPMSPDPRDKTPFFSADLLNELSLPF